MIRVEQASKIYQSGRVRVAALDGVDLEVGAGEFVAIMGPSGCGKSTLLHCLGGLDRPTSGRVGVAGEWLEKADEKALTRLRREKIGFVFQFFNLLPTLTVRENVLLPLHLAGRNGADDEARADRLITEVGLAGRASHRPHQLSGGQMQRVALARALVHQPAVILADEPTGNLDSQASARVVELFKELGRVHGTTVVLVTHSADVARAADRVVEMKDGRVVSGA
jgi:putative ABC transport system ATP-binding protein